MSHLTPLSPDILVGIIEVKIILAAAGYLTYLGLFSSYHKES